MAGLWDIIVPEATTNLISYPSIEIEGVTTGWTAIGGSIAQETDDPPFGTYNLEVTPTAGVWDGTYYNTASLTSGTSYTLSLYFKGESAIPYRAYFATAAGVLKASVAFTGDGEWHRYTKTWVCDNTAAHRIVVDKNDNASTAKFYVDGLQVEAKAYATTYTDGDQEPASDYAWSGIAHASTSTRTATARSGGRIKNLRDDYYFYSLHPTGIGAPPITNYSTDYALLSGALHEHTKIHGRLFILNGLLKGTSLETLHTRRAALYDILRPDEVSDRPVLIQYTGGAKTVQIAAYYDGGMEFGIVDGFTEKMGIRFYAPDPDWLEIISLEEVVL